MESKGKPGSSLWHFTITATVENEILVVLPAGRLGHASASTLQRTIEDRVAAGARRVAIDFSGVDYISGAGLRALDEVARRLQPLDGALALCALTQPARLTFELAGWTGRFTIAASRLDAIARLSF